MNYLTSLMSMPTIDGAFARGIEMGVPGVLDEMGAYGSWGNEGFQQGIVNGLEQTNNLGFGAPSMDTHLAAIPSESGKEKTFWEKLSEYGIDGSGELKMASAPETNYQDMSNYNGIPALLQMANQAKRNQENRQDIRLSVNPYISSLMSL